ncbi:hypothetical protein DFP73DRAFT_132950 [Morchella snyderi]|nr:hypothetical protein DFP73DRAFT_132950 [Morchella snyderi]
MYLLYNSRFGFCFNSFKLRDTLEHNTESILHLRLMAEVIGLVSGIIALIQLAGKLTSISYSYACGVKRASKDLGDLIDELGSLSKVLLSLRSHLERVKTTSSISALRGLNDTDGPLKVCGRELEELISQVEPRNGWKGVVDSIKWPLKEKDTLQLISRIERHKSLIMFALTADQMSTSREIEKHVQNIEIGIKEVRENILTEFAAQDAWRHKWDLLASKCIQFEDCNT